MWGGGGVPIISNKDDGILGFILGSLLWETFIWGVGLYLACSLGNMSCTTFKG